MDNCVMYRFQQFEHEPLLWQEVQALTLQGSGDPEATFLKDMFSHIPQGKYYDCCQKIIFLPGVQNSKHK